MSTATQRKTHCLFLSLTKAFLFELPQPPKQNKTKEGFRLEDLVIWEAESLQNSHITSFRYFLLYLPKKKKQAWMDIPFGLRVTSHISPHIYNPKLHAGLVRRPTASAKSTRINNPHSVSWFDSFGIKWESSLFLIREGEVRNRVMKGKKCARGGLRDLSSFTSYNPLFRFFSRVLERFKTLRGTAPYKYIIRSDCYGHDYEAHRESRHESREDGDAFLSKETFQPSRSVWFRQCPKNVLFQELWLNVVVKSLKKKKKYRGWG